MITFAPSLRRWWPAGFALALVLGAVLRLVCVTDMEYKFDECWTYLQARDSSIREATWLGIHNSTGLRCPGMSLWIFVAAAKVFDVTAPTELARVVQLSNVAALGLLAWFALRMVPSDQREPWLWATALAAVNPLAVVFQRKIWPPSVLPVFTILMLMGWWCRQRRGGAFLWGLVAAILGQIHPSGFFFAAAFFAWGFLFDRRRVAWTGWLAGSAIGAVPMLPWACYVLTNRQDEFTSHRSWHHFIEGKFWIRWITEPFGMGLDYSLWTDFPAFLRYPSVGGWPTYAVGMLHVVVVTSVVLVLARMVFLLCRHCGGSWAAWRDRWIGRGSDSAFTQNAALWGFGCLLTLSTLPLHRHYMVILFPLEFLWLARVALAPSPAAAKAEATATFGPGRVLLATLFATQLTITVAFFGFVHETGGSLVGDYGLVYRYQYRLRGLTPKDLVRIGRNAKAWAALNK